MNVLRNKVTTSIITQGPGTDMDIVIVFCSDRNNFVSLWQERRFEKAWNGRDTNLLFLKQKHPKENTVSSCIETI